MTTPAELDAAIADLQTELNRLDRRTADDLGVGTAEDLQMLRLLESLGPLRVGQIASIRAAGKATVSARIERLERRGLVTRERDPSDRRAVSVTLTQLGRSTAIESRMTRLEQLKSVAAKNQITAIRTLIAALQDQ